jgi:hypothetical protein
MSGIGTLNMPSLTSYESPGQQCSFLLNTLYANLEKKAVLLKNNPSEYRACISESGLCR